MHTRAKGLSRTAAVALSLLLFIAPVTSFAEAGYAYPKAGQDAQQQRKDRSECHLWAVEQTGFDPNRRRTYVVQGSSTPPPSSGGGLFGRGSYGQGGGVVDAAKGAGLGALGGAIAGDAGAGAAIGAVSGLFIGAVKRSSQQAERDAWERHQAEQRRRQEQQIAEQEARGRREYGRAYGACMSARNYHVG